VPAEAGWVEFLAVTSDRPLDIGDNRLVGRSAPVLREVATGQLELEVVVPPPDLIEQPALAQRDSATLPCPIAVAETFGPEDLVGQEVLALTELVTGLQAPVPREFVAVQSPSSEVGRWRRLGRAEPPVPVLMGSVRVPLAAEIEPPALAWTGPVRVSYLSEIPPLHSRPHFLEPLAPAEMGWLAVRVEPVGWSLPAVV
jgi:hypothetical protein